MVCKCCGAEGRSAQGCSCRGGRSHKCLLVTEAVVADEADHQDDGWMNLPVEKDKPEDLLSEVASTTTSGLVKKGAVCKCCGAKGRMMTGCSCQGGRSHKCLLVAEAVVADEAVVVEKPNKGWRKQFDFSGSFDGVRWGEKLADKPDDLLLEASSSSSSGLVKEVAEDVEEVSIDSYHNQFANYIKTRKDEIELHIKADKPEDLLPETNVFIKPLSGNSFAMNLDLSMVKVKDLKNMLVERSREQLESLEDGDLILEAEKTLWATGRMGLLYGGKHLQDSKLLGDYDVEKDSTIKIVFGLFGEGPKEGKKRAKGADQEPVTKEDALEEVMEEYSKQESAVGDLSGDAVLNAVGSSITFLMNRVNACGKVSKVIMKEWTRENMVRVHSLMDSKGGDMKINSFKQVLFKKELDEIKKKEDQIAVLKEAMKTAAKRMIISGHGNSGGQISWEAIKEFLAEEIEMHDIRKGVQIGHAAASA